MRADWPPSGNLNDHGIESIPLSRSKADATNEDEAALVEAAPGDPEAFAVLYRQYLTPVHRYLLRRSHSEHDAEDLSAQVFLEALEGLAAVRYRERGKNAWVVLQPGCSPRPPAPGGFLSPAPQRSVGQSALPRTRPAGGSREGLARQFGACRFVYNHFLRARIDNYTEHQDK